MARYADFDAALGRRGPLQFRLFDQQWLIANLPFGKLAAVLDVSGAAGTTEMAQALGLNDFFADVVHDRDKWLTCSADASLATLMGLLAWIVENEVGMPLKPDEGADPLGQPPASSPLLAPNGLSPVGSSPPSASTIP